MRDPFVPPKKHCGHARYRARLGLLLFRACARGSSGASLAVLHARPRALETPLRLCLPPLQDEIARAFVKQEHRAGDFIYQQGDPGDCFFVIESGTAVPGAKHNHASVHVPGEKEVTSSGRMYTTCRAAA